MNGETLDFFTFSFSLTAAPDTAIVDSCMNERMKGLSVSAASRFVV